MPRNVKVSCACRVLGPSIVVISSAQVSRIVVTAASQLWLSCCER